MAKNKLFYKQDNKELIFQSCKSAWVVDGWTREIEENRRHVLLDWLWHSNQPRPYSFIGRQPSCFSKPNVSKSNQSLYRYTKKWALAPSSRTWVRQQQRQQLAAICKGSSSMHTFGLRSIPAAVDGPLLTWSHTSWGSCISDLELTRSSSLEYNMYMPNMAYTPNTGLVYTHTAIHA